MIVKSEYSQLILKVERNEFFKNFKKEFIKSSRTVTCAFVSVNNQQIAAGKLLMAFQTKQVCSHQKKYTRYSYYRRYTRQSCTQFAALASSSCASSFDFTPQRSATGNSVMTAYWDGKKYTHFERIHYFTSALCKAWFILTVGERHSRDQGMPNYGCKHCARKRKA